VEAYPYADDDGQDGDMAEHAHHSRLMSHKHAVPRAETATQLRIPRAPLTADTKTRRSDSAPAIAVVPYTTACSPKRMSLPGADACADAYGCVMAQHNELQT
jgi:hypothetical protein